LRQWFYKDILAIQGHYNLLEVDRRDNHPGITGLSNISAKVQETEVLATHAEALIVTIMH